MKVGDKFMADEVSMGEGLVGQKLPHDLEMIVTAFLPNLKYWKVGLIATI
jgi:hypothetical protein